MLSSSKNRRAAFRPKDIAMNTPIPAIMIAAVLLTLNAASAPADEVVSAARLQSQATVEDILYAPDHVSGQIINHGNKRLDNVQILVTYAWLWSDDRRTDEDAPGWSEFHTLAGAIPPNGSLAFSFPHQPLPAQRDDGHFLSSVRMVGFTEFENP